MLGFGIDRRGWSLFSPHLAARFPKAALKKLQVAPLNPLPPNFNSNIVYTACGQQNNRPELPGTNS
jgi:hypothetical protein